MTVTYHSGRRIQATQADFDGTPAVSGGWKELARTTLGSTSSTIDVTSIPDKRYYQVLLYFPRSGTNQCGMRINNDSGSNYSRRFTYNGAADSTGTSETSFDFTGNGSSTNNFAVFHIANLSSKEKLILTHVNEQGTAGAANIGDRREQVSKWANTSNALDQLTAIVSANNYASGAEMVVLGYDPDDTHTTNFWEELASVELSSAGDNISSGTFTAKKYLWVQCFMEQTDNTITGNITFNGDTGSNYSRRRSNNGATDSTGTSESSIDVRGGESKNRFENMFIINNSAQEKLVIGHHIVTTAGAGNAPDRTEYVAKWANTSSQITSINFNNIDAGNYGTKSFIKVWGSN